ncbi:heme lyase CcmF/NrfE family subunit [Defluviicoccus vanus]|uniref:Heme lyase CcmF/NrfE family subunit n=1 Tax=Defluviicoccus vanus TaxID=111831 RepID=A0A7H1MXQ5_9PROT|nr:heme lyase CcmF/NrfE family subunit [Defluviicoccus vanus]QNT68241.1 heme lyase CcmF/NrfE family subunit [Defluviicoccus vanus]
MTVELGHFALALALVVALVQGILPMLGAARGRTDWMEVGTTAALTQVLLVVVAFGCLVLAYVTSDFSVLAVASNSHSAKPLLYKISGSWGNHEGSMLLWVLILAVYGAALAIFGNNVPPGLKARALAVQGWIGVGFYLFILFTSNPFARLIPPPEDGRGLNPLLQDPGLAFHPPFLYLGYVGFSMAFSFAIAALIEGRVDAAWARWVRPWTLAAWTFLTLGIGLGSWWAYYELGWGGWWYWDPVENASLLPWLAGTALLHSAIVVEKRDALKAWTVFLAILAFSLSLLGTFLVRSGVLTSVHAFATDPTRGIFILLLLVLVIGGSLLLFAWRGPSLQGGGMFQPISREGSLLVNNLLLGTATATVLLGTLFPLLAEAIGSGKVSVGPPFFNATFVPLMTPLVLLMVVGPLLPWKRADLAPALKRLWVAAVMALVVFALVWLLVDPRNATGAFGLGLATWLLVGTVVELAGRIDLFAAGGKPWQRLRRLPRSALGMTLAHGGTALLIAGVSASGVWKQERILVMAPGETTTIGGYSITFEGAGTVSGANYSALQGHFIARAGDRIVDYFTPERRIYPVEGADTTEAAIKPRPLGDLYVVIGEPRTHEGVEGYVVRLYFEPLVQWIWIGVLVMAVGGIVSLSDRRLRVGAPARRRAGAAATVGLRP